MQDDKANTKYKNTRKHGYKTTKQFQQNTHITK